jgi:hypothetical protein
MRPAQSNSASMKYWWVLAWLFFCVGCHHGYAQPRNAQGETWPGLHQPCGQRPMCPPGLECITWSASEFSKIVRPMRTCEMRCRLYEDGTPDDCPSPLVCSVSNAIGLGPICYLRGDLSPWP